MSDNYPDRRRRVLTDEDITAIADALRQGRCDCSFTDEEVQAIRNLVELIKETRSYILKGVISIFVVGVFTIMVIGFKQWAKH